jgi:murein peptide amidase A
MNFLQLKSGYTVEGDEILTYKTEGKAANYVYLLAGVHGDEVEGVYVLNQLFEWLKEEEEINHPSIVVPILNIDGYRAATRTNAHGVDLNRNFAAKSWTDKGLKKKYYPGKSPMSEPENLHLDKLFQKHPPRIILTFHSWKPMLNYNGNCLEVAAFIAKHNGYTICDSIENHPTPGSLGQYAVESYNCPVLTFECPVLSESKTLKDIWKENSTALKAVLASNLLS